MKRLILLRHGQSLWNLENKFIGWTDVDLSVCVLLLKKLGLLFKRWNRLSLNIADGLMNGIAA